VTTHTHPPPPPHPTPPRALPGLSALPCLALSCPTPPLVCTAQSCADAHHAPRMPLSTLSSAPGGNHTRTPAHPGGLCFLWRVIVCVSVRVRRWPCACVGDRVCVRHPCCSPNPQCLLPQDGQHLPAEGSCHTPALPLAPAPSNPHTHTHTHSHVHHTDQHRVLPVLLGLELGAVALTVASAPPPPPHPNHPHTRRTTSPPPGCTP
jgi:hypothetical protein